MKNHLISGAFIGALLFLSSGCNPSGDAANHDSAFSNEHLLKARASELKQTVVVATPEAPIEPGTNVIWCGTFQLAWNEACALIGEDIHLEHEPPMVSELNKRTFTAADLDSASYVALAGFVKDGIHKRIREGLAKKFGNSANPVMAPDESLAATPNDIVAYAYLFKHLEFAIPFVRLDRHLEFGGRIVPAFGMTEHTGNHEKMAPQVVILSHKSYYDFVIELKTKSRQDRLILAKIQPGKTLNETIQMVNDRIGSAHPEKCEPEDELAVPKFNFDILRTYAEIEGAPLVLKKPKSGSGYSVTSAKQTIRFQMDEKGVSLKSEAQFIATLGIHNHLVFDKPFLVMLKRTDAKAPYFAMWVDNPELLVPK